MWKEESVFWMLPQFFPPNLSPSYLKAALIPVFETVEIAAGRRFLLRLWPVEVCRTAVRLCKSAGKNR